MCLTYVSAHVSLKVLGHEVSHIHLNGLSEPESSGGGSRLCRTGVRSLGEAGVAMAAHIHMHLTAAESRQLPLVGDTTCKYSHD